jgi:hypothetical protein
MNKKESYYDDDDDDDEEGKNIQSTYWGMYES